uniref:EF-hand domain-containing protein n=1 Tax=Mimivirus LCMiAC01 TaxID=2506608 RepID=A0A481YZH6_9VIRU|nr:MAG: hypothetical protein LCMiAC01_03300 [Mimivirus LCMiAC01]
MTDNMTDNSDIKEIFEVLDSDNDGIISKQEFEFVTKELGLGKIDIADQITLDMFINFFDEFRSFDLSKEKFIKSLQSLESYSSDDDTIDAIEFIALVKNLSDEQIITILHNEMVNNKINIYNLISYV